MTKCAEGKKPVYSEECVLNWGGHSVVLMSQAWNAPYPDEITGDGQTIIYVGHNVRKHPYTPDPKSVDQPRTTRAGKLTQNGKFYKAA